MDCIFVFELQRKLGGFTKSDGEFNTLPSLSLLFLVVPAFANLVAVFILLSKEWKKIEVRVSSDNGVF